MRYVHSTKFRVFENTEHGKVDATDKYLALSGKLLRSCRSAKVRYSKPSVADKHYDANRATGYFEAITGYRARKAVLADRCVHGERRPRYRYVTYASGKWEIPNWDWNGHNHTLEQCQISEPDPMLLFA